MVFEFLLLKDPEKTRQENSNVFVILFCQNLLDKLYASEKGCNRNSASVNSTYCCLFSSFSYKTTHR